MKLMLIYVSEIIWLWFFFIQSVIIWVGIRFILINILSIFGNIYVDIVYSTLLYFSVSNMKLKYRLLNLRNLDLL